MKTSFYMEDGIQQIVLTPQTDFEKSMLGHLHDSTKEVTIKRGSFFECQGGWVRNGDGDESTILVMTPKSVSRPEPDLEPILAFCYALLAPGQDANDLIQKNPDMAKKAHRALYDRKPQLQSYDDMMASIPE